MVKADELPGIGFEDTHLNVRMGLLTLIIIGDGIISVTRIVNRTVGNGWTRWSFVHIFGVTISVVRVHLRQILVTSIWIKELIDKYSTSYGSPISISHQRKNWESFDKKCGHACISHCMYS